MLTAAPAFSKTQITLEMAQEKLNHLKALKASGATEDEEGLDIDSEIEDWEENVKDLQDGTVLYTYDSVDEVNKEKAEREKRGAKDTTNYDANIKVAEEHIKNFLMPKLEEAKENNNANMIDKWTKRIEEQNKKIEEYKQKKVKQDERKALDAAEKAEKERIANMVYPLNPSWTNWNDFVPASEIDDRKDHFYGDSEGRVFTINYKYRPDVDKTVIAERIDGSDTPVYDSIKTTIPGEKSMTVTFNKNIQSEYVGDRVDYALMMDGNHSGDFHQFFKVTFYSPFEGPAILSGYDEHRKYVIGPVMYRPPREDIGLPESLLFLGSAVHIRKGINTFYLAHTYNRLFYYSDDKEHKNGIVPTGPNAFPQKSKITSISEIRLSFNNRLDNNISKEGSKNFTKESYDNSDYYVEKCRELLGK